VTVIAVLALPASVSADTGSAACGFSQHVVMWPSMGFDGQHDPGTHPGFAGWHAAHTC